MKYEKDKSIHKKDTLDVEVDENGKVVAVWFNCLALAFRQSNANVTRASDMERMYADNEVARINSIDCKLGN